jgi:hypothetical protein
VVSVNSARSWGSIGMPRIVSVAPPEVIRVFR